MTAFNLLAGIASIIGFFFSYLAWQQAKTAAQAAKAARDAVVILEITEVLERSSQRAEQLSDLIQHQRFAEASMRVGDLMPSIAELQHRRGTYLKEEQVQALATMAVQLVTIRERLVNDPATLDAGARRRILTVLHKQVVAPLHELVARAKALVDEEIEHAA